MQEKLLVSDFFLCEMGALTCQSMTLLLPQESKSQLCRLGLCWSILLREEKGLAPIQSSLALLANLGLLLIVSQELGGCF